MTFSLSLAETTSTHIVFRLNYILNVYIGDLYTALNAGTAGHYRKVTAVLLPRTNLLYVELSVSVQARSQRSTAASYHNQSTLS